MKIKDIKALVIAMNSSASDLFKYPIGNAELCEKLKALEALGRIRHDRHYNKWLFVK
jgi:hypothetical protein